MMQVSDISSWSSYNMNGLKAQVLQAREEDKFLFIWDKSNTVSTYFRYQALLHDFEDHIKKVQTGRKSASEAMEELGTVIKNAKSIGQSMLIDLGSQSPDFTSEFTFQGELRASTVFDRANLSDE